jgi:epoxyqueuosine reductase QueG/putative sterol carrier protein
MKLSSHPTVKNYNENQNQYKKNSSILVSDQIKQIALDAGVDDVGLIELNREPVLEYKSDLFNVMHDTKSMMIVAARINQVPLRSLAHSIADLEFKRVWENFKNIEGRVVDQLAKKGIKALGMPIGFPMEMKQWPDRIWLTNEKLFAVEAGLGQMGMNRLLLHPKYGAAVVLGTILMANECDQYDQPLDYNPCVECGLCVKVCPTGAVKRTDSFDFISCYSHNYRERIGGFLNWVEQIVESKTTKEYRRKVSDGETFSMWQNLSVGSQTRCDRCMAVCPAGESAIGEFLDDREAYINHYQKRFRKLPETIYAVKGSDSEQHVRENFPEKTVKNISNGLRPLSIKMFLENLPRIFQANQSEGMNAVYHFSFSGNENIECSVTIREKTIIIKEGLKGSPDLHVTADSQTWIRFLAKEANLLIALLTRKIKIKGSPKLMKDFAKCFPA